MKRKDLVGLNPMATEIAGSSSASADSFDDELISLMSISEIRYEGHLLKLSSESCTLRNVRCFGTEGRRKDGPQLPPYDRICEYVVFRGSNIKNLQVISSPSPCIYDDPAIIVQSQNSPPIPNLASMPLAISSNQSLSLGVERSSVHPNPPRYSPLVTPSRCFQPELGPASRLVALPRPPRTIVSENSSLDSGGPKFAAQVPVKTLYTEEFDFMAMNKKFNKDEIWGELNNSRRAGKNKKIHPSYVKDGFFDTLSAPRRRIFQHEKEDEDTIDQAPRGKARRGVDPTSCGPSRAWT